jgi:hypothetical protein
VIVRWLSIAIFLLFALPLAVLLFLSFFRPESALQLSRMEPFRLKEAQRRICQTEDDDRLVRAAVRPFIGLAVRSRDAGRPLQDIWFPYFTCEEFRAANPDCCHVRSDRPGDFSPDLDPFFRGHLDPKVYVVELTFKTNMVDAGQGTVHTDRRSSLVTCYGDAIPEDELRSFLYRASRPVM